MHNLVVTSTLHLPHLAGKPNHPSLRRPMATSPVAGFPHQSPEQRALMVDLLTVVESSLGPKLLPSVVPPDVLSFVSPNGAAEGSLDVRAGAPGSPVDFILQSWLHCKLPTGNALDITTFSAYLNAATTNAPHLLVEFFQSSPTPMIIFIDLPPCIDLVTHPEYLDEFYQSTELDKHRKDLESVPQVLPYRASSLYFRSMLSPTAIAVCIDCGKEGEAAMREILAGQVSSAAKEIIQRWLISCAHSFKHLGEVEKAELVKRDNVMKNKTFEIDLSANLPQLFGPEIASRVVEVLQKAFGI